MIISGAGNSHDYSFFNTSQSNNQKASEIANTDNTSRPYQIHPPHTTYLAVSRRTYSIPSQEKTAS